MSLWGPKVQYEEDLVVTMIAALKEGQDHQLRHQQLHAQQGPEGQFPRHFHRPTWRSLRQLLKGAVGRID